MCHVIKMQPNKINNRRQGQKKKIDGESGGRHTLWPISKSLPFPKENRVSSEEMGLVTRPGPR